MDEMLFEVAIHRTESWDKYRVLATKDMEARKKAIEIDNKVATEELAGKIVYCEIEMISEIDG